MFFQLTSTTENYPTQSWMWLALSCGFQLVPRHCTTGKVIWPIMTSLLLFTNAQWVYSTISIQSVVYHNSFLLITSIDFRLVWYLVHSVFYPVPCTWSTVYWHSFILQNKWQPICTSRIKKYITFTWQNDDFPILSLSIIFKTLNT